MGSKTNHRFDERSAFSECQVTYRAAVAASFGRRTSCRLRYYFQSYLHHLQCMQTRVLCATHRQPGYVTCRTHQKLTILWALPQTICSGYPSSLRQHARSTVTNSVNVEPAVKDDLIIDRVKFPLNRASRKRYSEWRRLPNCILFCTYCATLTLVSDDVRTLLDIRSRRADAKRSEKILTPSI